MDLLRSIILNASSSPASTIPTNPSSPSTPHLPTDLTSPYPSSTSQPTPIIIPFLKISSPVTSILPPTPPTSLVSPIPHPGLMLSTPSISPLPPSTPFHLSPSSTISTPLIALIDTSSPPILPISISSSTLHLNPSRHPFIGILPGASTEVFLAPQPLHFIPPPPSTFIYTLVILSPLSHDPSIPLNDTLPPLPSLLPPSPSSLPHPSSLTFTFRHASSSSHTVEPTFSILNPSTSSSSPPFSGP